MLPVVIISDLTVNHCMSEAQWKCHRGLKKTNLHPSHTETEPVLCVHTLHCVSHLKSTRSLCVVCGYIYVFKSFFYLDQNPISVQSGSPQQQRQAHQREARGDLQKKTPSAQNQHVLQIHIYPTACSRSGETF